MIQCEPAGFEPGTHSEESSNHYAIHILVFSNSSYSCLNFCSQSIDANRLKPHLLRTSEYCWCDKAALEDFSKVCALV